MVSLICTDAHQLEETVLILDSRQPRNMDVQAIHNRGSKTMTAIYGSALLPKIFDTWGSHREDVRFNETFAVYGLYLSDFEVLTPIEAEAVVYASISCQGFGGPGNWHLRGMGRMLGARGKDNQSAASTKIKSQLNNLRQAVMEIVRFVGDDFAERAKLDKWASVDSMLAEFVGWGDD